MAEEFGEPLGLAPKLTRNGSQRGWLSTGAVIPRFKTRDQPPGLLPQRKAVMALSVEEKAAIVSRMPSSAGKKKAPEGQDAAPSANTSTLTACPSTLRRPPRSRPH